MNWIALVAAIIFCILSFGCLALVLVSFPGTWIMILLAVGLEFLQRLWAPAGSDWMFPWWIFLIVVVIAALGEFLELIAGAFGAKKGGASKKGMLGALIGGVLGAIVGTFAIPIPLIGSLLGAIAGSAIGAIIGELNAGSHVQLKDTVKPAAGAVIGRILGTLAKFPCAVVVWTTLSVTAIWQ